MKAIILSAGKGERLRDVVDDRPKPMINIRGKPILEHNIDLLGRFGTEEVYINLHHLPEVIRDYFGDGSDWGVKITYSYEHQLLGTAGAVRKIADDYWDFKDQERYKSFLVIYGDNLIDCDLAEIIDFHKRKKGLATIGLHKKADVRHSGIVVLDEKNRIVKFIEKPKPEEMISNLVNAGLYILRYDILDYITQGKNPDFGRDVFPKVITKGENIFGVVINGTVTTVDTPELLEKAIS